MLDTKIYCIYTRALTGVDGKITERRCFHTYKNKFTEKPDPKLIITSNIYIKENVKPALQTNDPFGLWGFRV